MKANEERHREAVTAHLRSIGVSDDAAAAYLRLLEDGVAPLGVVREELDAQRLVVPGTDVPVPLRLATSAWVAERRAELDLVDVAAHALSVHHDATRDDGQFVEVLKGIDEVVAASQRIQQGARDLLRCFDRPPYLSGTIQMDPVQPEILARGVTYRTVYLASNLHDDATRAQILEALSQGEDARVHGELPMRITIADDDLGLVILPHPAVDDSGTLPRAVSVDALLVHPSTLLDVLIDLFESTWARSIPVDGLGDRAKGTPDPEDRQMLSPEDRQMLALMSSGLTDARVAAALGVSERTMARRISRLQDRVGASSRFMLGLLVGRDDLV